MASIENKFKNDDFALVTNIDDITPAINCNVWADEYGEYPFWENASGEECVEGSEGCASFTVDPIVIDDGEEYPLANLFRENPSDGYPVLAIISHEMVVQKLFDSCNSDQLEYYIQKALDEM